MSKHDRDQFCYACGHPMGEWWEHVESYSTKTGQPEKVERQRLCSNPDCYRKRPNPGRYSS